MEWVDSMLGGITPERKLIILFPHPLQALVRRGLYSDLKETLRFSAARRPLEAPRSENKHIIPPPFPFAHYSTSAPSKGVAHE